jgi:hypothetical protein
MKAEVSWSGNTERRGYGRIPHVHINLEPEGETEKAILQMAYSGRRTVSIWSDGTATIEIAMPRGKNG